MQKFHFGIYGIIIENNTLLLVNKSRGPYKGKLDLPGGKPEHGESPLETLRREILEETGISIEKAELLDCYSTVAKEKIDEFMEEITHHVGVIYRVLSYINSPPIYKMETEDSLGANWYAISSLDESMLSPFAFRVIKILIDV